MSRSQRDGGWGWVVVAGAFLIQMLFGCVLRGFGVLYLRLLLRFKATPAATSWVGTAMLITMGVTGPIGSLLIKTFSCRSVCMFGSLLLTASIIGTGVVPSITFAYMTFGAAGIGLSLCYNVSNVVIDQYFQRKKGFAFGVSTLGSSAGMLIFPPVVEILFRNYGYTGGVLLFGGITLHGCVAGALFYPLQRQQQQSPPRRLHCVQFPMKKQQKQQQKMYYSSAEDNECPPKGYPDDFELEEAQALHAEKTAVLANCNPNPLLSREEKGGKNSELASMERSATAAAGAAGDDLSTGNCSVSTDQIKPSCLQMMRNPFLAAMAYFHFAQFFIGYYMAAFVPAIALERLDITLQQAALAVTALGTADILSKVLGALTFDLRPIRRNRTAVFSVVTLLSSLIPLAVPFVNSYVMLLAACAAFGLLHGIPGGQRSTVLADLIEPQYMVTGLGMMLVMVSLGCVTSGITAGILKAWLGTYIVGVYLSSFFVATCSIILLALTCHRKCRSLKNEGMDMPL